MPAELTPQDWATLVEKARDDYVMRFTTGSIPTTCAVILFDMLARDIRETGQPYAMEKIDSGTLQKRMRAHPDFEKRAYAETSVKRTPNDIRDNLDKLSLTGFVSRRFWRIKIGGPGATHRGGNDSGLYYFTITAEEFQPRERPPTIFLQAKTVVFPDLIGRCFCCQAVVDKYDPNDRRCPRSDCYTNSGSVGDPRVLVAVLPEPRASDTASRTPPSELLAHIASDLDTQTMSTGRPLGVGVGLPYATDFLAELGLSLGRPTVYRSPRLEVWSGFRDVYVLDTSTYGWSNTIKDIKCWTILNVAIERGAMNLIAHTHGNVGLGLTKLAYQINRLHNTDLTVHCVIADTDSPMIRDALVRWGAEVHLIPPHTIDRGISPSDLWRVINKRLFSKSSDSPPDGAWNVSDGWDGVGICAYRSLFADLVRRLRVDSVLVPIGTGDLLLGAYLAIRQQDHRPSLLGALPVGHSGLGTPRDGNALSEDAAVAPKLARRHTPLARCISFLRERGDVAFLNVTKHLQREAIDQIAGSIASEPSALVALAALRELADHSGSSLDPQESSVLVVNSGIGLFDEHEINELHHS